MIPFFDVNKVFTNSIISKNPSRMKKQRVRKQRIKIH